MSLFWTYVFISLEEISRSVWLIILFRSPLPMFCTCSISWERGIKISACICGTTFLKPTLLRYNLHNIQFIHLKCTVQCFLICSQSCANVTRISFKTLHHFRKNPVSMSRPPFLPTLPAVYSHSSVFLSYRFACCGHFIEGNTICGLCEWFLSLSIFEVHLCFSLYQYFTPFYGQIIFHCLKNVNWTIFNPFISLWTLGFLHFLAFVNNATLGVCVRVFVWTYGFISSGCTSRIGILGSYDNFHMGFPGGSDSKEYACNAGELSSIHGKIPWRREWLPTPVFLPGQFHGQMSLVGYSPWGHKELDTAERLTRGNLIFNLCVKLSDGFPKWLNHFTFPSGLFCFAILSVFASFVLKVRS